jgi:hypothetical protein
MSADNFNTVIQTPDGKWIVGKNFSMSHWLDMAQATGYWAALRQVQDQEGHETFDSAEQAAASVEGEETEYGTSMIAYEDWFGDMKEDY